MFKDVILDDLTEKKQKNKKKEDPVSSCNSFHVLMKEQ